jgi:hypothetical protein
MWSKCPAPARSIASVIYEKIVLVVESRGSTEVWQDGQSKPQVFEWQKGSLFTIPLNAHHRIINAASSPALLLCGKSAPNQINLTDNIDFVFSCPYVFKDRFSGEEDSFKPKDDIEPDPVRGLAMRRTNIIPDIVTTELPLDKRRSPGYRRVEPHMGGNRFYTYTWPEALGMTPWKDGQGDKVLRQDYEPVGIVSAAPMSGDWYHQHFGISPGGLRLAAWHGPNNHPALKAGRPGEAMRDVWAIDVSKGGNAIPYHLEDPFIRAEFEETMRHEGAASRMEPVLYDGPPPEGKEVPDVM